MNDLTKIAVVGNPNVGKSALFNRLTGSYATVSNYPGTTVEVMRGRMRLDGAELEVIDTPGMYMLMPITEEEKVARDILLYEKPNLVIHMVDAKNLERMASLTLELVDASFDVILSLNMMDEARKAGLEIDCPLLEEELGIPVVGLVATTGEGVDRLKKIIHEKLKEKRAK